VMVDDSSQLGQPRTVFIQRYKIDLETVPVVFPCKS